MGKMEKKIMTKTIWWLSLGVGLFVAEQVYNKGTIGYVRMFHPEDYNKAIKDIQEEEA